MCPASPETALVAFFRRHSLVAPLNDCDGLIERHGLVLAMALAMREAEFRAQPDIAGGARFGNRHFAERDILAAAGEAHRLAAKLDNIAERQPVPCPLNAFGAAIDAMALAMRRLDEAGCLATPSALLREGFTTAEILEAGPEAITLAEAIGLAVRRYHKARIEAAEALREAA